jgi:hypothetical protein
LKIAQYNHVFTYTYLYNFAWETTVAAGTVRMAALRILTMNDADWMRRERALAEWRK